MNIEQAKIELEKCKNVLELIKYGPKTYFINTGYFYFSDSDIIEIYIEETKDGKLYLTDGGATLKHLDTKYDELPFATQTLIVNKIKDLGVEFNGKSFTLDVRLDLADELYCFVAALLFIIVLI